MSRIKLFIPAVVVAVAACSDVPSTPVLAPTSVASLSRDGGSGEAGRVEKLELRDQCDQASFDAALGAGTCVRKNGVPFDDFIAQITKDGFAGGWKINPDHLNDKPGTSLSVTNIGGETHTFTQVTNFGGGIVDLLNQLSGNTVVADGCANLDPLDPASFVPPGHEHDVSSLAAGTYNFQCCIHPWMRTVVTIRN
jgi:plastocyanin